MGAKVDRSDKGWEVSVVKVDLTARGKEVFGLEEMVSNMSNASLRIVLNITTAYPPNAPRHRLRLPRGRRAPRSY